MTIRDLIATLPASFLDAAAVGVVVAAVTEGTPTVAGTCGKQEAKELLELILEGDWSQDVKSH